MSIKNERQLSQKCKKNELRKHRYQLKQEKTLPKRKKGQLIVSSYKKLYIHISSFLYVN
ncbi:hypothetical protein SAIL_1490 [Streptococcus agalactiae ILRI112]|nr:hypothetical protein SAIL_1490 [Streptococcus agalactiae ILRI112]